MMALCSLPRTNPRDRLRYVRRNGPYTLVMNAGGLYKLPFGHLPRLLMAWISTEAVRTQSRVLVLGDSLSDFMRELGIYSSDGKAYTRLRNQMERLFNASVRLIYEDKHGKQFVSSAIADRGEFWWDPKRPNERVLWDSKIRLGEDFFNEIISHPVPINMNILTGLKRSSIGPRSLPLGSPTAPLRFALRCGSPGRTSTASWEWTRPRPTTTAPSRIFGRTVCVS